jgi:hypothetical protein
VTHVATGTYRLSFPGYAPDRRYLISGMARGDLRDVPHVIEHVVGGVDGSADESLGLYVRISSLTGSVVDSAFEIQIYDASAAP